MTKHFYIFRHGECPLNVSNHIQGQKFNGNLTDEGIKQALNTAYKLKNKQISLIISSPLNRAIQTAKIIATEINTPIMIDHRFIEVNMGIIEGMHISTVKKNFSSLYQHWQTDTAGNTRFTGGESKQDVRKRIFQGLNFYAIQSSHKNIGISTHGIALSQIMQHFGIKQTDIPNGAVLHISHHSTNWQYDDFSS